MTAAVILAAGAGSRLSPLTYKVPKPFLPLANSTIFGTLVAKVDEVSSSMPVYTNLHHRPDVAIDELHRSGLADRVQYRIESELRGPAGSLLTFLDDLREHENILVVSGDVVFDGQFAHLLQSHYDSNARITVATSKVLDGNRFGVFVTDHGGSPTGLVEKPDWAANCESTVSAGIYVIHRSLLSEIPTDMPWDFGADLIPALIKNEEVNLWPIDGAWDDVGSISTYHRVALGQARGRTDAFPNVRFEGRNHISRDVVIGDGTFLRDCILLPNAQVPEESIIANAVIG